MTARARSEVSGFNRPAFEAAFRDFLSHVTILSKNSGYTPFELYDLPWAPGWGAQEYGLTQILDGLEAGVHWFVVLKPRQVGWTTLSILFDVFWCGTNPGLQGAIVADTDANKEKIRLLIVEVLEHLPPSHRLRIAKHNRNGLVFEGGSMLDYLVAGTKKKTGSLGRSRAYNFIHATELAQWGDPESLQSLISSLSEIYPARFYNFESTAHGYDMFHEMWETALDDDLAKRGIFLAWWMHPEYIHRVGTKLFERYGHAELTEEEKETARIVKKLYGYTITRQQWAWYRHRKDPRRRQGTEEVDEDAAQIIAAEYPSYPDEAFQMTGKSIFTGRLLDEAEALARKRMFKAYWYNFGSQWSDLRRRQIHKAQLAQLRIWEEPHPNGRYILAADPSYGSGESADRHCAQILRCYADRLVQVAEFCVANIAPIQFTWVIADLCGWYNNCRWIIELNGPGEAVMTEFRHMQTLLATGLLSAPPEDEIEEDEDALRKRSRSALRNVRDYLYHRPDALSGSYNLQFKMGQNKETIMTQFADQFLIGKLIVNSVPALWEMRKLVRKGMSIEADGAAKDDRPVSLALGVRCWIDHERPAMDAQGRTFARESETDAALGDNDTPGYMNYILAQRARDRALERRRTERASRRTNWNW